MSVNKDEILVEKFIKGDVRAFERLVNIHKDMVYSIAVKIVKNTDDAEEIAMDAFMKAFNSIASFRKEASFSSWVYKICYNLSLSHIRKKQVEKCDIDTVAFKIVDYKQMDPYNLMLQKESSSAISKAFEGLDEEGRLLLELSYVEGKKIKDIALELNQSESNIKVKIHRTKKKLTELLELEGVN